VSDLDFRVERFSERHLPLVARFSEQHWGRPRTHAYYQWRYLESLPFSNTFVAVADHECLGLVCALRKNYLIGGQSTSVLEFFDWHSLPHLKGSGVGIRVVRALMREGMRLVGVGGTADVHKALPAMGFQTIGQAVTFELPLKGEFLQTGLRRRLPIHVPGERFVLNAATGLWFRPRRRSFVGQSVPVAQIGPEVQELYGYETDYDVLQVPDAALLRWATTGYSGAGGYRFWYFTVDSQLRGWALTRLYETARGREGAILDVFAATPDVELYAWMVSEVATSLAGEGPRVIRARATCPMLQRALSVNRFRQGAAVPVYTFPAMPPGELRLHITLNHTDAPFRPYPATGSAAEFFIS